MPATREDESWRPEQRRPVTVAPRMRKNCGGAGVVKGDVRLPAKREGEKDKTGREAERTKMGAEGGTNKIVVKGESFHNLRRKIRTIRKADLGNVRRP